MAPRTKQAEEERLLLESSRHVTRTATALFYGNGLIISALPLCTISEREIKMALMKRECEIAQTCSFCNPQGCIGV